MSDLYVAKHSQLSLAWFETLNELMRPGVVALSPFVATITEFDEKSLPREDARIRRHLDGLLANKQSCRTVASTIFPNSLWRRSVPDDSHDLYSRYEKIWPRVKKCRANSNGVYFRRMTSYLPKNYLEDAEPINQLQHVIDIYKQGTHRHSALQASIFDPTRDHSSARQRGFPCLQQVAFGVENGNLELTGFYAKQYHVAKAYGNYLGLCWLGRFMAQQMDLSLTKVTCVASMLELGKFGKTEMLPFVSDIRAILNSGQGQEA
jgi:hypothetical protein